MEITLLRHTYTQISTLGTLYIDGKFHCFTLEDADRLRWGQEKLQDRTAIPSGVFNVVWTYSPRFERELPLLVDVPGFTGVRIHSGNRAADTSGCILVGLQLAADAVYQSRLAFTPLSNKIMTALHTESVRITIAGLGHDVWRKQLDPWAGDVA